MIWDGEVVSLSHGCNRSLKGGDFLVLQNGLFHGRILEILIVPLMKHSSFLNVFMTRGRNNFHDVGFTFKNPEIVFLPDVPDKKSWDKFPYSI